MYRNAILFAGGGLALAMWAPSFFPERSSTPAPPAEQATVGTASPDLSASRTSGFREAVLPADRLGQYAADVLINGTPVRMLVDTGASVVVLSTATAARLGLVLHGHEKWKLKTASGSAEAEPVVLETVSFGGLYMNDVQAVVLPPEAGDTNLLGASFLKRLAGVEQRDGTLVLRQ